MGKNFSCNNVEGKRKKSDFYETPYSITRRFLHHNCFSRKLQVLEPACGEGAIVRVLQEYGFSSVIHYDKEVDYLTESKSYDYVITNPPFSLAKEFILKSSEVATVGFSLLLPLSYLHGKQRYDEIYSRSDYRLKFVDVFTRYPLLGDALRPDGKYSTGMMVYAWFTWERSHTGYPTIRWIDNDSDILRKSNE